MQDPSKIRNIAIIAHVDHGKTTFVDGLLKQSQTFRDNQAEMSQELIMDSGDQEKERGITITAKVTAVNYDSYKINIIDTPGHADFSGEVERTLNMADGALLIVDAQEGPMPQTKFVLSKALLLGLKPIVIINKVDKTGSRIHEVEDEIADLFLQLALHEDQLFYPTFYAIGRLGKCWQSMPNNIDEDKNLDDIFRAIIEHIPAPIAADLDKPFQMLVSALAADSYKGKYAIGRVHRGTIKTLDKIAICRPDGQIVRSKVEDIYTSRGMNKVKIALGVVGDIIQVTGLSDVHIGDTLADADNPDPLPALEIEAPTLKVYIGPNTSPFKGQEGKFISSREIGDRLLKELETNIGLRVEDEGIGYLVSGRGELHLSILIETMRREGFEFEVGRPQVVTSLVDNKLMEPIEELNIEIPAEYLGTVQTELGKRRATLKEQFTNNNNIAKIIYEIPTRAMIGLRNVLMTNTKGTIIMNSLVIGHNELGAQLSQLRNGALVSFETGVTTPYALQNAEARGITFVGPATKVYAGQVIGLNNRMEDIEINVCKAKHLTNMRSSSSDGIVQLTPPTILSLEQAIDFIEQDELVEVTPVSLRIRKIELDHIKRKRTHNI